MELHTGTLFNWRVEGENLLFIAVGFSPLYGCMFHTDTKILSIYDYSEEKDDLTRIHTEHEEAS